VEQSPESVERDGPRAVCPRGTRVREAYAPPESGIVAAKVFRGAFALVPVDVADVADEPASSAGPMSLRGKALVEALRGRNLT
jgi:hypothetical protein